MENWKTIEFRGRKFMVSDLGNVKTSDGTRNRLLGTSSSGYACITKDKCYLVHRIVAHAFIPNPNNKPQVNHINGNKKDNTAGNLEWMTKSENDMHSVRILGNKRNITGLKYNWENPIQRIPVCVYTLSMDFVLDFNSCKECAKFLGVSTTAVNNHLKGRTTKTGNHIIKYKQIKTAQ